MKFFVKFVKFNKKIVQNKKRYDIVYDIEKGSKYEV